MWAKGKETKIAGKEATRKATFSRKCSKKKKKLKNIVHGFDPGALVYHA